jgi:large subunit ribosomal protein L22
MMSVALWSYGGKLNKAFISFSKSNKYTLSSPGIYNNAISMVYKLMGHWRYPRIKGYDESKIARAVIRDVSMSFKEAYEVCKVVRGMRLAEAKEFLKRVMEFREPIPYTRYKLSIGHKRGLAEKWVKWKTPIGRYPIKVVKHILKLLDNVENNAVNKGLDVEKLRIIHIAAHRSYYFKKWMPRAFGRATPWFRTHTSVEVVVAEV